MGSRRGFCKKDRCEQKEGRRRKNGDEDSRKAQCARNPCDGKEQYVERISHSVKYCIVNNVRDGKDEEGAKVCESGLLTVAFRIAVAFAFLVACATVVVIITTRMILVASTAMAVSIP